MKVNILKQKKTPFVLGAILFVLLALFAFVFYTLIGDPPKWIVDMDLRKATEIEKVRKDKSDWKRYTNTELGFSLLLPPDSKPYNLHDVGVADKTGGKFQGDIEFDINRMVIIPTYSAEDIEVGVVDNFQRVKYVSEGDRTYIYPQEYIHNFPLYAEQKGITLEKLENTDLIKISDRQYHHYGNRNLSFYLTSGDFTEWMYQDNLFSAYFYKKSHSKVADQIKQLQLEILQTIEFLSPSVNQQK